MDKTITLKKSEYPMAETEQLSIIEMLKPKMG